MSPLPHLSHQEFEAFVFIYASHVDYQYSEVEKNFIIERVDQQTYDKMFHLFENNSDYQSLKILLKHKEIYCSEPTTKQILYDKITTLFKVDGDYSRGEKLFLNFIDNMIIP